MSSIKNAPSQHMKTGGQRCLLSIFQNKRLTFIQKHDRLDNVKQ